MYIRWFLIVFAAGILACNVSSAQSKKERDLELKGRLVSDWIDCFKSEDPAVRRKAALALIEPPPVAATETRPEFLLPPKEREKVRRQLEEIEENRKALESQAWQQIGPAAMPVFLELYKDAKIAQAGRIRIMRVWQKIGPAAKEAVPVMIAAFKSDDRSMYPEAAAALWEVGPGAAAAIPLFIGVLRKAAADDSLDVDPDGRAGLAAVGLANMSPASVPAVLDLLTSPDPKLQTVADEIFQRAGPSAIPGLREALKDKNPEVRKAAAKALKSIDPKADQPRDNQGAAPVLKKPRAPGQTPPTSPNGPAIASGGGDIRSTPGGGYEVVNPALEKKDSSTPEKTESPTGNNPAAGWQELDRANSEQRARENLQVVSVTAIIIIGLVLFGFVVLLVGRRREQRRYSRPNR